MYFAEPLPAKEMSLYKKALQFYRREQYKNAIKFINQVLSTPGFENHPESLGLKGLIIFFSGKPKEGYDTVRQGLKSNIKSAMCWNCYGSLYRHDKSYEEAIKCLTNALRWQNDDYQTLVELSILQIQIRDFEGFLESRKKIIKLKPQHRSSWSALAVAYHLLDEYDMCREVLLNLRKLIHDDCPLPTYSEFLIYENSVIEDSGDSKAGLIHLNENQEYILDKISLHECYFRLNYMEGNFEEAEEHLRQLLLKNPENGVYYELLFDVVGLQTDKEKYLLLKELLKSTPNAKIPELWILNHAQGEDFVTEMDIYLQRGLRRDVPALFVEIKPLYMKDKYKTSVIEGLMFNYLECLKKHGTLTEGYEKLEPSLILWVYYFLAQHYCRLGKIRKALKYINLAICHTPTVPELYVIKGKIYKKAGNPLLAADYMFEALLLDPLDRSLNSKCVKYLLQAGRIKHAKEVASAFVFDPNLIDEELLSTQNFWYLKESALAYERLDMFDEALKKCYEIDYVFNKFYHEQFDYHDFAFRELALRNYVIFIRSEDTMKRNKIFKESYHCGIRIHLTYFKMHKNAKEEPPTPEEPSTSSGTRKATRKEKKKGRKDEEKMKEEIKELPNCPLEEASRILHSLQLIASDDIHTHIYAYEINLWKNKILLMLQAIKRGHSLDPDNGVIHQMIVVYALFVDKERSLNNYPPVVFEVIDKEMERFWRGRTPEEMNEEYFRNNSNRLEALFNVAYTMYRLDPENKPRALELCTSLDDSLVDLSVCLCKKIYEAMSNGLFGPCEAEMEDYLNRCRKKFPLASVFTPFEPDFSNLNLTET